MADTFILVQVADTTYALRSADVDHMEMMEEITPVPNAAPFVDGVVFTRGRVVPVVNLRARFGFERIPHDQRTRLAVVRSGERSVGLIVDGAREFATIPAEAIHPPQEAIVASSGRYVEGITTRGDRIVLILNIAEVLNFAEQPVSA